MSEAFGRFPYFIQSLVPPVGGAIFDFGRNSVGDPHDVANTLPFPWPQQPFLPMFAGLIIDYGHGIGKSGSGPTPPVTHSEWLIRARRRGRRT